MVSMEETNKTKILIIDDEHSNILALVEILGAEFEIFFQRNGAAGIKAAFELLPDIILLDILMPEMDGYEVLTKLKQAELTRDIPVIFITGLREIEDEKKGFILGAVDYITKPFISEIVELRVKSQAKIVEQMKKIEHLSMTDQLTGLPNRRCFDTRFNSDWGRALREQTPISVLIMDVDNFKKYNDSFGHQQGDFALQSFGKVISKTLKRPGDFAARWGGEEFIVLLPDTNASGAIYIAEEIRRNIEEMTIPSDDEKAAKITVSIGVNTREHGDSDDKKVFFIRADDALYASKEKGRNTVSIYNENHK